ncbi:Peptidyl-lysine N-acetyltransferase Pat [Carnimonas sp. R-84981]|uniref:bifunctional acetate--CoA ligase family protein/GNAT family N-acetyltransferase n=1 Tax=Carnimonas bestiolae TaxID=3402172 RepID=UPI003EDC34E2
MSHVHPETDALPRHVGGTRFLRRFFSPGSLLLVADPEAPALAEAVLDNLVEGGFGGVLYSVGLAPRTGCVNVTQLAELGKSVDLAITCVPITRIAELLEQLGSLGIKAVIVLRDDEAGHHSRVDPSALRAQLSEIALRHRMRVIGPDCVGIAVPDTRLNATFAAHAPLRGHLAYLGQSGMLGAVMASWSRLHGIGMSHLISLGDSVDVRLSDMLDFIAQRTRTQAIVLNVDRIDDARHFISALREAARRCVVLAIGGTSPASSAQRELPPVPGVSRRSDIVDAALRRAGTLRIDSIDELYDVLEVISRIRRRYRGPRLMIIANGSAPSLLASEALSAGGTQAVPSEDCRQALIERGLLRTGHPLAPLDLGSTASVQDFTDALNILADDPGIDAFLILHGPTRMAPPDATARAVIKIAETLNRPLLAAWMGTQYSSSARHYFSRANIACFATPERAITAFIALNRYQRVQELLWQRPRLSGYLTSSEQRERVAQMVESAYREGQATLHRQQIDQLLRGYGVNVAQTEYVESAAEGEELAQGLFGAHAVKALHSAYSFPFNGHDHFDVRGISPRQHTLIQDVVTPSAMRDAIERISETVSERQTEDQPCGFAIQGMRGARSDLTMSAGITRDAIFGPVIVFGRAGYSSDIHKDRQVALPPLNTALAVQMIQRSSIYALLSERMNDDSERLEAAMGQLSRLLVTLSQMCADLPYLAALELHPVALGAGELSVLDYAASLGPAARQAIRPYPEGLKEVTTHTDGGVEVLRPVRAEDATLIEEFHTHLSARSQRFRYFQTKATLSQRELAQFAAIDYDREMAFVVEHFSPLQMAGRMAGSPEDLVLPEHESGELLGVVRLKTDSDNLRSEFSLIVRDDHQRQGLGLRLMEKAIAYARNTGIIELYGEIMWDNHAMYALLEGLEFNLHEDPQAQLYIATLQVNEATEDWQRLRLD